MKVYGFMAFYSDKRTLTYSGLSHDAMQNAWVNAPDKNMIEFMVASVHESILWGILIDTPKYQIENFKSIDSIVYRSFKPK